jgi:PleD family two-component response regulator
MFASEDLSAQALLHAADHALYQAKALGRNQAVLYAA